VPHRSLLLGRVLSGLGVLFLLVDAAFKFALTPEALAATTALGYDPAVVPAHILFPVYIGLLLWSGLWLRDAAVRAVVPWRSSGPPAAGTAPMNSPDPVGL
jgi:hypothetical protein